MDNTKQIEEKTQGESELYLKVSKAIQENEVARPERAERQAKKATLNIRRGSGVGRALLKVARRVKGQTPFRSTKGLATEEKTESKKLGKKAAKQFARSRDAFKRSVDYREFARTASTPERRKDWEGAADSASQQAKLSQKSGINLVRKGHQAKRETEK